MIAMTNFALVGSYPWKKSYFSNIGIVVVLVFNLIINALFVVTPWFGFLGFVKLDAEYSGIMYAIGFGFGVLVVVYNWIIRRLKLYKRQS